MSGFNKWEQKEHAEEWLVFPKNIGSKLSIDETAISKDELYTIVTNKAAKGKKGAIVAIVKGVKSADVSGVLSKISQEQRNIVKEVTLDMSNAMDATIRISFPQAKIVTDRFHVQQLVSEAVQEIRVTYRKEAIKEENETIKKIREKNKSNKKKNSNYKKEGSAPAEARVYYIPEIYENGDTKKQLLARSRYLLFKPKNQWSEQQEERSKILFKEFSDLEHAHNISMNFRSIYENSKSIKEAKPKLAEWYKKVEDEKIEAFFLPAETISLHETNILNYFVNRSTNASAESFNAKLKGFRALVRGVRDKKFFLFRIAKLYA